MRQNKYPDIGETTMVMPVRITDLGVYVKLLEYDGIEGLIILSDLSKSRFRSIGKVVSVGKKFPATVTNVDANTGNISLSKKEVSPDEATVCENNFRTSKQIYDLANFFVRRIEKIHEIKIDISMAYHTFIWIISDDPQILYSSLRMATKDFAKIYGNKLDTVDPIWVKCFQEVLSLKFKEKQVLLEAVLEITCQEEAGVCIIKSVLLKGQSMATNEYPFKIKLVKAPYYSITINTMDQEKAIDMINNVISTVQKELENNDATTKIIKSPKMVVDEEFKPEDSDDENSDQEE